jgi:hypothetical protein
MSASPANFYDLTREDLRLLTVRWGFSPVHAARLWAYVYLERLEAWALMTELPARFRAKAEAELAFPRLPVAVETHSADGFTRKYLLALADERRDRAHALHGPGDRLHQQSGRLRDGLRVLRDRTDGLRPPPHTR